MKRARGASLSLLEVVVALALFVLFMTGLFATLDLSRRAELVTRQRQAASEAGLGQLSLVQAIPVEEVELSPAADQPVSAYAFHAEHDQRRLRPVALTDVPLNVDDLATPADEAEMAGRVFVVSDPDGDGSDDLLEIRVIVAWRAADGGDPQRVDLVSRRVR